MLKVQILFKSKYCEYGRSQKILYVQNLNYCNGTKNTVILMVAI